MNKKEIKFDFCVCVEELINFIDINSDLGWDNICDMEYEYRKSRDFENDSAYPIIILREYDNDPFHKWCEMFYDAYIDVIGNRTLYIIHD